MRNSLTIFFALVLSFAYLCKAYKNGDDDIVKIILDSLNTSVDPCNDFYQYSCGGWIKSHPLPADESAYWKSISSIQDNNLVILRKILENQYNNTFEVDAQLTTLYGSCMDRDAVEEIGDEIFFTFAVLIDDNNITAIMDSVAKYQSLGVSPFFNYGPILDSKNPDITIAQLTQGGLNLPDASLYEDKDIMSQYLQHIINMFTPLYGNEKATIIAKSAITVEQQIASFTVPPDQLLDPFATYNKIDLAGLKKIAPEIPWDGYFNGFFSYNNVTQITVDAPSFYTDLSKMIDSASITDLESYMLWCALHIYAPFMPQKFVDENFRFFGQIIEGLDEPEPLWETCVELVDEELGMLLGEYFVKVAFSGDSKEDVSVMIESVEAVMKNNLENIAWMDDVTRQNALTKLSQVSNQIGYPADAAVYDMDLEPGSLFRNVMFANWFNFNFSVAQIEKPTRKDLWEMTPATVDAYYDPTKNGMVFPAGILQNPFFDAAFAPAIYFGGAGVIMGHELTHGFDDQGRDYDGRGVLTNWWEPETAKKFDDLTTCVVNQFSTFEVLPDVYVNGNLTLGENLADMGGTKLSYLALQNTIGEDAMKSDSVVPGFTNKQLFFVAYAQGWCANQTPESLKIQVLTNPHSPARYRVIGPLINHPYFAETFNCPVGSYMNPKDKCAVW